MKKKIVNEKTCRDDSFLNIKHTENKPYDCKRLAVIIGFSHTGELSVNLWISKPYASTGEINYWAHTYLYNIWSDSHSVEILFSHRPVKFVFFLLSKNKSILQINIQVIFFH